MNSIYYASDRNFINADNLDLFCNTNLDLLTCAPRGIVLEFPGLGGGSCLGGSMDMGTYGGSYAQRLADAGLVLAYVFPGPWSWMNKGAVRICDLVADALMERCGLPPASPLIATGGSMGGLGALIYAADSRHKVTACAATCPGVDARAAMAALDALPRTFLSAVAAYDMPFGAALASISPAARIADMPPEASYLIMADCNDELFPFDEIKAYAQKLKSKVKSLEFIPMENCTHGGFTSYARQRFTDFIIENGTI